MQDVRELMERMVRAFATGDVLDVNSLVDEKYVDHQGLGGIEILGAAGFRQVVEVARSSFLDLDVSVEDLIADGDRAAARLRWVGKRALDGVTVTRETIDIVRFEDNRAVEHWGVRLWVADE